MIDALDRHGRFALRWRRSPGCAAGAPGGFYDLRSLRHDARARTARYAIASAGLRGLSSRAALALHAAFGGRRRAGAVCAARHSLRSRRSYEEPPTMMSDFHFSPRPNRAHEIAWMPWGAEAFARARSRGQADPARDLRGVVPLVPRDGRNVVLRRRVIDAINERLRAGARRQRPPSRRERALQHGRLADDRLSRAGRHDAHRRERTCRPRRCAGRSTTIARFYAEHKDEIAERAAELRAAPASRTAHASPTNSIDAMARRA